MAGIPNLLISICDKHYSPRTKEQYLASIKRFILYHGKRHPTEMGEREVSAFLSDLALKETCDQATRRLCAALSCRNRPALNGKGFAPPSEAWPRRLNRFAQAPTISNFPRSRH
ncbi:MAG: hypothetical protein QOD99_2934 [Chthoniobacter sp.]|nr:hypothetical protein [Chthoniobacter sp.]